MLEFLNMAWKILFIVFFFGFCIFIHEFGHLLAGIWMKLYIDRFSIGFGKKLLGFKYKGIEFLISLLPLGGYVSLPQLDPVDNPKTTDGKPLPQTTPTQRLVTAFAGPFFNVLFGFVLATIMCFVGLKEAPPSEACVVTSIPPVLPLYENGLDATDNIVAFDGVATDKYLEDICRTLSPEDVGKEHTITIQKGENQETFTFVPIINPEWEAGLRTGDRIIAINGKRFTKGNEELMQEFAYNEAPQVELTFVRDNAKQTISFVPHSNPMYENLAVPFFEMRNPVAIATVPTDSPAAKYGLADGDQILQVNNVNITSNKHFLQEFQANAGKSVTLLVARASQEIPIVIDVPQDGVASTFGVSFSVLVVNSLKDLPAYKAGIRYGDRIVSVNGKDTTDATEVTQILGKSEGKPVNLGIMRDGKMMQFNDICAVQHEVNGRMKWIIGVSLSDGVTKVLAHPSPWTQFTRIIVQTKRTLGLLFSPITSKISGRQRSAAGVKVEHMSGPLGIVMMLWYSLKADGLRGGLAFIILITFSLAIMNLLPIPVLDGGHILFSLIEYVIRRHIPNKLMNILMNTFACLLIALMLYITFFDGRRAFRLFKAGSNAQKHHTQQIEK